MNGSLPSSRQLADWLFRSQEAATREDRLNRGGAPEERSALVGANKTVCCVKFARDNLNREDEDHCPHRSADAVTARAEGPMKTFEYAVDARVAG